MRILSHRGYWKKESEKNKRAAFVRSFELGFGTETDVRDCQGRLVVSHDMPAGGEMLFEDLLNLATKSGNSLTLALNVKADGLAAAVKKAMSAHSQLDYFFFDMSIPDMRSYLAAGVPVYARMSEVERFPAWLDQAEGIWLDAFDNEWYDLQQIAEMLTGGGKVCVVSSELHGRPHDNLWAMLKKFAHHDNLLLCTDFPEEAACYFGLMGSCNDH